MVCHEMLSIKKMSVQSASYYTSLAQSDYYLNGGEPPGQWHGLGAAKLGLKGEIAPDAFMNLFGGYSPDGKTALVQNAGQRSGYHQRVPGWDMSFSAPKSVSICWALSSDPVRKMIATSHEQAVRAALDIAEKYAGISRMGKGGRSRVASSLCFALFEHGTSRANDPQLHTHAICLNLGIRTDGTVGALFTERLFEMKMALGAVYQAEFGRQLQERLGYSIYRTEHSFEVTGINRKTIEYFSTRRAEILAFCEKFGAYSAKLAANAATQTRTAKSHVARDVLFSAWREAASGLGLDSGSVEKLVQFGSFTPPSGLDWSEMLSAVKLALQKCSVAPDFIELFRAIAREATSRGFGAKQIESALRVGVDLSDVVLGNLDQGKRSDFAKHFNEAWGNGGGQEPPKPPPQEQEPPPDPKPKSNRIRKPARARTHHSRVRRKVRQPFAVMKLSPAKGLGPWVLWRMDLKIMNLEVHNNRLFPNAPFWSPVKNLRLPVIAFRAKSTRGQFARRLVFPLAPMTHAAVRQVKQVIKALFKAGVRRILLSDQRMLRAEQAVAKVKTLVRSLRKPRVFVGRTHSHVMTGLIVDWKEAGGVKEPKANLILAQTGIAAEKLNRGAQALRKKEGYIGGHEAEIGGITIHQNERIRFLAGSHFKDLPGGVTVLPGDFATVTHVSESSYTIRLDRGEKMEMPIHRSPKLSLGYAVSHEEATGVSPSRVFIRFEANDAVKERLAIKRWASQVATRIYTDPDAAVCFTIEGVRQINTRIAAAEMKERDKERNKKWAEEWTAERAAKENKTTEQAAGGDPKPNTAEPPPHEKPSARVSPDVNYWDPKSPPDPMQFEEQRDAAAKAARAERMQAKAESALEEKVEDLLKRPHTDASSSFDPQNESDFDDPEKERRSKEAREAEEARRRREEEERRRREQEAKDAKFSTAGSQTHQSGSQSHTDSHEHSH